MALCLGWKVTGARVQPNLQIDWRFDAPTGPRHMRIRRLAEAPSGVREVRISCHLDGFPGALIVRPEDQDRRLAIHVENSDGSPRTVSLAVLPLAELLARQLSDRDRDPIFRRTMTVAQSLAQSVLGT